MPSGIQNLPWKDSRGLNGPVLRIVLRYQIWGAKLKGIWNGASNRKRKHFSPILLPKIVSALFCNYSEPPWLWCFVLMSPDVSDIFILGSFFREGLRRNIGALTSRLITLGSAFGHLALWARHPAPLLRVWFSKPAGVLLCYHSSCGSGLSRQWTWKVSKHSKEL